MLLSREGALSPDDVLKSVEDEIDKHDPSRTSQTLSQKKDSSPDYGLQPIKIVKGVSKVNPCCFAQVWQVSPVL